MKGFFLFCSIIYLGLFSLDLAEIREQYRNAAEDQYNTYELYKVLSPITESEAPELVAYKGAATTLMAKYAAGIKAKKAYIREGKRLIEYAIELFPSNIELRYIRLSVQENAPKVMGYKGQITEDKEFITSECSD